MSSINGDRVAELTSECGKKLKVKEVAGLLVQTLEEMEKRNPIAKQVMDKCGDDLCGAFFGTLTTLFSLHLLARTHNTKEFNEIMKTISSDENAQA